MKSLMMTNIPLVSIYIPTHNRSQQLRLAVESVRNQTFSNLEIFVVDDGSTDDTPTMMRGFASIDSRITYIRNENSLGACNARNKAILESKGDFVTGLDDDDEFTPKHLENLVAYWNLLTLASIQAACIYVQFQLRDENVTSESAKRGSVHAEELLDFNHVGNQIFAPRSTYIDAGLFDESMPAWQDLEFFYRVLKKYGIARLLDIPSYILDISPRTDRISLQQKNRMLTACNLMYEKHGKDSRKIKQRLLMQVHSGFYGFKMTIQEFLKFCGLGFSVKGYLYMFSRLIKNKSR